MEKYSLWVVPEEKLFSEFKSLISHYSEQLGTPLFHPHMTLLGEIESSEKDFVTQCKKLANFLKPFEMKLGDVEISSTYYQCVFARVRTSDKLLEAYEATCDLFGIEDERVFMPHVSIVYGDVTARERHSIAQEIQITNKTMRFDTLQLVTAGGGPSEWKIFESLSV